MGIGTSIFLIAVGAILYFAVNADISGLEISTVGLILMIVGDPRPDHLALPHEPGRAPAPRRARRRGRSCASATSTSAQAPGPPGVGASSGLIRPRWSARRVGHLPPLGEVVRADHERDAGELARGRARVAGALREPERADDVAPVVLDLEQLRAARQLVVELAHLLARLQLDGHRLRDDRRDGEVARGAVGVAAAQRRGPALEHGAQALGVALARRAAGPAWASALRDRRRDRAGAHDRRRRLERVVRARCEPQPRQRAPTAARATSGATGGHRSILYPSGARRARGALVLAVRDPRGGGRRSPRRSACPPASGCPGRRGRWCRSAGRRRP